MPIFRNIKNAVSAPKNLILRGVDGFLTPRWLWFEATDRCNSRCAHCNIWQQSSIDNPLTAEDVEKVLSDPLFKNVEYILNSGGEPVVRNDLKDIILAMHRALPRATLQLSTNGLLPGRVIDIVNTAMKYDINLDVGLSLDGLGEKHDAIRGVKGNFEKVDQLIHELVGLREEYKDKLRIALGIVLSDMTLDSLGDVREYAEKLNISLVEAWYNRSSFYDNYGNEKDRLKEQLTNAVKSQPSSPLQEMWLRLLKGKSIKFPCFALNTFCVLKCNGDIIPCLTMWDAKIGNVRDASPSEIWNSNEAKKVRKMIKKCQGCLNTWGLGWSFQSRYYPLLSYYLRHPKVLFKKLIS